MKIASMIAAAALLASSVLSPAWAQQYANVPAGDAQYAQCLIFANSRYQGGTEASPVAGQTKAQAFCTCMWQETPDDFKGNLVTFSETEKGKSINRTCEKYSNWE